MERALIILALSLAILHLKHDSVSCIHLPLKRTDPFNHGDKLNQISAVDRMRHASLFNGTVNFPLRGSISSVVYTTTVKVGTPGEEFTLQADTAYSDYLWITDKSCSNCPSSPKAKYFDRSKSSTAAVVKCSKHTHNYSIVYNDQSGTSGYCVRDNLSFNIHPDRSSSSSIKISPPIAITFGCSTRQSGDLARQYRADGILGLGQGDSSIISQLSSRHLTPRVFSHCLIGDDNGGGTLVIGEIIGPKKHYSPLFPSQAFYGLNLQTIALNGKTLRVDPSVFAGPTVIDIGSTTSYIEAEAYHTFVDAITTVVLPYASTTLIFDGKQCYYLSNSSISIHDAFPRISLGFAGNATMVLRPRQYLVTNPVVDDSGSIWCLGFEESTLPGTSILGVNALRDRIFEYDLDQEQLGWVDCNCSLPLNVSNDQYDKGGSNRDSQMMLYKVLPLKIMVFLLIH